MSIFYECKHIIDAKLDFFISDANAFYQDADAKYPYDAHVLLSEMQFMISNGHVMIQMFMQVRHDVNVHVCMSRRKCPLVGMS